MSAPGAREAEFHSLIEQEATFARSVRLAFYEPGEEQRQASSARRSRLAELSELLGGPDGGVQPNGFKPWDVEYRIDRWIETHPLTLTNRILLRVVDRVPDGITMPVRVVIGEGEKARGYPLHAGDVSLDHGSVVIRLSESIAEEFRQQGIRSIQRQFASLMAVESLR